MLTITIRDFTRNMKDISERIVEGEGFLVSKNSTIIFEIKPSLQEGSENLPVQINKQEIIKDLQEQIQLKLKEVIVLNQHIDELLKNEKF